MIRRTSIGILVLLYTANLFAQTQLQLRPQPEKPPGAELSQKNAIPAPDDVAEPPEQATRHASGLISLVLEAGTGEAPVGRNDEVTLHYTGWTTDGVMFDSSRTRGAARTFQVSRVIDGFAEGLTLMVPGEQLRIWVPGELAYDGISGKPQGTLVFDLELLSIRRAPVAPADLAGPPDDAVRNPSGLAWVRLTEGSGDQHPGPEDMVVVEFSGWEPDGKMVETTRFKERPANFTIDLTLPGFSEALQQMVVGESRRLWMPPELVTFDPEELPDGPRVFEIELLSILKKPVTPVHVAAPPADAIVADLGISYEVLREGTGEVHPDHGQFVEVYYAGWTRDGEMFDSSYRYGRPGVFGLTDAMPVGWNETIRAMVVGESRRVWIPKELAYGDRADRPQGMLVFEIELLAIHDEPPPPPPRD